MENSLYEKMQHLMWLEDDLAKAERASEPYGAWEWAREALSEARQAGLDMPNDILGTGKWPKTQKLAEILEKVTVVDELEKWITDSIEPVELVAFTPEQLPSQPGEVWDDNGSLPDGDLWLLPVSDVEPFPGMEVVKGWEVSPYSKLVPRLRGYCGFSSRDVAYTVDYKVAKTIAEYEAAIAGI